MTTITCLMCEKELDHVVPDDEFYGEMGNSTNVPNIQPYDGVMFVAEGNYGSKVHDPCDEDAGILIAVVCDECVVKHRDRLHTMRSTACVEPFDPLEHVAVVDLAQGNSVDAAANALRSAWDAAYYAQYGHTCIYCAGTIGAAPDDPNPCVCGEQHTPKPKEE